MKDFKFKVYLGKLKDSGEPVYLEGFEWSCGWYYGGGYVGNKKFHSHFDGCFLKMPDPRGHVLGNFTTPWDKKPGSKVISNGAAVWESLDFFLDDAQFDEKQWWRIKDLYEQFYAIRAAAEVLLHGGHCTEYGRTPSERQPELAGNLNKHLQDVVIPEIMKALGVRV